MKAVIFTGAGAGQADGLPTQTGLFHSFFTTPPSNTRREQLLNDVAELFAKVFQVDPRVSPSARLPTFEEVLGVLDLAIAREEGILGFGGPRGRHADLQHIRRQLILALAVTVSRGERAVGSVHARLVASLREKGLLSDVTFITTNYDTFIDDAIETEAVVENLGTGSLIDYGFRDLSGASPGAFDEVRKFPALKIHGSLNWLFCPSCGLLDVTYDTDGVLRLIDEVDAAACYICETTRTPIIVPPSYYKNMSNVYLDVVWNKAYQAIKAADQVVFCGYSFPDADMHVKYLMKRSEKNRGEDVGALHFVLANNFPDKTADAIEADRMRFARFLGNVEDSGLSFEEFADQPETILFQNL